MNKKFFILLCSILFLLILLSFGIGRYPVKDFFHSLVHDSLFQQLIFQIRAPRILTAVVAGLALSLSGSIMQTVFRNPLADPGTVGVSQAAGFGAAIGILYFRAATFYIQAFAFLFSLLAMGLTFLIARQIKSGDLLALILAGMSVSAIFSAGLGILKYLADPIDQLPNIVFWLLGSLANANWQNTLTLLTITVPLIILLWFYRWRLNIHSLEREISFSLGMNSKLELYLVMFSAVFLTSSVISFTGVISWIGLIIPNLARFMVGQNTSKSLPLAAILGAIFLLICDDFARSLLPGEIPLGIFTAFFGAVLFIFMILKKKLDY